MFRHDLVRQYIVELLLKSPYLPENLCIHGFKVAVKKRTLKRRTTIVKHSRFLRNMEVFPLFPPEPEPVVIENPGEMLEEGEEEEA